jgi:hypothetical protein
MAAFAVGDGCGAKELPVMPGEFDAIADQEGCGVVQVLQVVRGAVVCIGLIGLMGIGSGSSRGPSPCAALLRQTHLAGQPVSYRNVGRLWEAALERDGKAGINDVSLETATADVETCFR